MVWLVSDIGMPRVDFVYFDVIVVLSQMSDININVNKVYVVFDNRYVNACVVNSSDIINERLSLRC
jgi:hypothetical protein